MVFSLKKLTCILATALSVVVWFSSINSARAESSTVKPAIGITSLYNNKDLQTRKAQIFSNVLKYTVATPFELPPGIQIPPTKEEFDKTVVPSLVSALGDGSVTEAWLDFQGVKAATAGNQLFTIDAPIGEKLYTVVAGKPLQQCPIQIEDTQIAYFTEEHEAVQKASQLDQAGYLVYVSPVKELREKVLDALYDRYTQGNKESGCFLVNGATKKITVDLKDIYGLLPPDLQQPARQEPFVFTPKGSDFLYVVNARKTV